MAPTPIPVPAAHRPPATHLSKSPPTTNEYTSTAPIPALPPQHTDEPVPSHLYRSLPHHFLVGDAHGRKVPDYLRMILMSKVYSAPLNLKETPLTYAVNLSARLGNEIWIKREDLQPVFSCHHLLCRCVSHRVPITILITYTGNHAQGVALSGHALGIPAVVVMPVSTPSIKWRNVQRLGATVLLHGRDFDEAKAECLRLENEKGLTFVPPYDNPYVVAGQGTVAMEICRQVTDADQIDGIFAAVGGGGLAAGIAAYMKRVAKPTVGIYGVETVDGDAMARSLDAGKRILLDEVGPFADGTAVRLVGEEPFRVCKHFLDDVVLVNNDEICAAIKDVFEETRSVPEPSGALALAGLKAHIIRNNLQGAGKRFVAVISGGNMNFGRLRFVAERADVGERREVLMSIRIPEKPGSFLKFHSLLGSRAVTEFSYRYSNDSTGYIICSFLLSSSSSSSSGPSPEARAKEIHEILQSFRLHGIEAVDLSEDEFAKSHVRHLVGGRSAVEHERIFRFEFPERPGALGNFLKGMKVEWNISMFHYRNHGADVGKVLIGVQVPSQDYPAFDEFLETLGYPYVEETNNEVYTMFLRS
ncbi:threonine ammonia-lyase, biosynthetic [Cryptococcus gattii Ru294]|uniref:Threonine dehydratase n=1 Tax=Cryptococcus gattii serotype B (strain WM276 / ATCC MYA-4071) TaxID=367775 RepID=E6RDN4_CRYGW|nr:Threonine ammonia-lyase, putative [Cryptococcus gattii WM276]ADV24924.1 Threonine ammonia-lyase, putative [Cryptococcus gattii WM276]KIR55041.1 threonine ammonia-lyase, biosynthetic [Cryptococcus gattii Ru294]KJE05811.1 threonine ammonia-lyase, biosynthetic [Cryptococcus gattii NT-10]